MTKFSKIAFSSLAVLGAFLPALPASAEDLAVSATVISSCAIVTAPVAFGSYDPSVANAAAPLDAAGSVTVTCTLGSVAHILLSQGANDIAGTPDIPQRRMLGGTGAFLNYYLYTDAGRTGVWGNTDTTGVDHTGTGAASLPISVFGRIPAAQNVPAAAYADTVAATVTF